MRDGTEPIDPDEIIYKRAFHTFYNPQKLYLSSKAFNPINGNDDDGISVTRAAYTNSPEDAAATGSTEKRYYVIELRAGDLEAIGLHLKSDPTKEDLGHAVIPSLNALDRGRVEVQEKMIAAAGLARRIHGPFFGKTPPTL